MTAVLAPDIAWHAPAPDSALGIEGLELRTSIAETFDRVSFRDDEIVAKVSEALRVAAEERHTLSSLRVPEILTPGFPEILAP